jgi:hypothetical protein
MASTGLSCETRKVRRIPTSFPPRLFDRSAVAVICGVLKLVELGVLRLDKFRLRDRQRLVQDLSELLSQHDCDRPGVAGVNRDWECARVPIIAVDRPLGFPDAIGVAGRMTIVTNEQNSGPEILVEAMLGFDCRQIIAGGNDATVQNDKIIFVR